MPYDFASLNAARRHKHKHHKHHRHHNRAGVFELTSSKKERLTQFAAAKVTEGVVSAALGAMDGNTGEAVFFQSTDSAGKVDPTSGIGLKAGLAAVSNLGLLAKIMMSHSFGSKMGAVGDVIDGAIEGVASASWCSWSYLQGLTYGKAKRASSGAGTGKRVDYSRQAPPQQQHAAPAPQMSQRSAGVDWYWGNFAHQAPAVP